MYFASASELAVVGCVGSMVREIEKRSSCRMTARCKFDPGGPRVRQPLTSQYRRIAQISELPLPVRPALRCGGRFCMFWFEEGDVQMTQPSVLHLSTRLAGMFMMSSSCKAPA